MTVTTRLNPNPTPAPLPPLRQVYAQNMDDLGAKMNVALEFLESMKAQLAAIDEKLDSLTASVSAMHADLKRLAGRPFLEIYHEWVANSTHATGSELQSSVYIPPEVCGPGPKKNFEVEKDNPKLGVIEVRDHGRGSLISTSSLTLPPFIPRPHRHSRPSCSARSLRTAARKTI